MALVVLLQTAAHQAMMVQQILVQRTDTSTDPQLLAMERPDDGTP